MSSITVSSLVLGSLTVEVDGSDSTLALSVLGTAPASLTIELGTPGAQGDAATIAVGTTTTLAPGSSATVANVGTSSAAVFNFGIPQGQTGATGATGAGVPIGGTDGQVLAKIDTTDYNTTWVTPSALQVRNQVRNETGAQLDKGTVVYVNGAAGNKVTVTKALATGDATSAQTFAVLLENIPNNQNGYAVTSGLLENLDTSAYAAGTQLYLSPTTAGAFTSTKPSAPDHLVYVGVIERSHANQGSMLVRIQNGYELDELHDVAIASKTNNDLIAYESATDLWKNKSASTLGLATTAASDAAYLAKASNLSDLANTATARTNLGLGTAAVEPATKLVPAGGTTGQVLSKASNTSWDLTWATAGGGGGGTVTTYFTPGTYSYTIPAGATQLFVMLWGAGGGGGSGARNATTAIRTGGGGGSSGACAFFQLKASDFTSPVTVVVAPGGTGGAAQTVNATNGNPGTSSATLTSFGNYATLNGNFGLGGSTTATFVNGGTARNSAWGFAGVQGGTGGSGQSNGVAQNGGSASASNMWLATGGGGGSGRAANVVTSVNGGNGGLHVASGGTAVGYTVQFLGGAGQVIGVSGATNGLSFTDGFGGTGGGGGGYATSAVGGNAGNGGSPGGAGGGGGASDNGFNSGAGGNGGDGAVIVIAY